MEAILGANAFRDMFADIRNIVGGNSAAYERELQRAKDLAIREMVERAHHACNHRPGADGSASAMPGGTVVVTAAGRAAGAMDGVGNSHAAAQLTARSAGSAP